MIKFCLDPSSGFWPTGGILSYRPLPEPGVGMSPALVSPTLTSLGALCSGWPRAAWTVLKCCCLEQRKLFIWFYFIRPHGRAESAIGQSWSTVTCCSTALLTLQRKRFFPFIAISFPKKSCRYLINVKSVRATLWFLGYPANSVCQRI